jgi:uncharacterized membrane protein
MLMAVRKTSYDYGKDEPASAGDRLARGLGWFSLGLGVTQVVAPGAVSRWIGLRENRVGLLSLLGAREIASGIGILCRDRRESGLWARAGGDAMDLALLGAAFALSGTNKKRVATTALLVAGVTALDVISARQSGRPSRVAADDGAREVKQVITINRSAEDLYRFWRDFRNLPRFMKHLVSVETMGLEPTSAAGQPATGERSHWVAPAPAGTTVEWDAEITEDRPNELIAWRSLEGADVNHRGRVRFEREPGGRGTLVTVDLHYIPPLGLLGSAIAKVFGEDPRWQVRDSLRRFKQVMETGEVLTTEGQPAGRAHSLSWRYDSASRLKKEESVFSNTRAGTRASWKVRTRDLREVCYESELLDGQERRPGGGRAGSEDSEQT